jgi:hypothetical protein
MRRFFKAPYYDKALLEWAEEHKTPKAVMGDYTRRATNLTKSTFTGPVMVSVLQWRSLNEALTSLIDLEVRVTPVLTKVGFSN